jgi:predicted transcriptional regulator
VIIINSGAIDLISSESSFQQNDIDAISIFEIKKRGFLQIVAEILESLMSSPIIKTHISFKCNLDSRTISKYITMMELAHLIEKSPENGSYYRITQNGVNYLKQFHSFIKLLDDDKINLTQYHSQISL